MPKRIVPFFTIATEYNQAGEDALALTLVGKPIGEAIIVNTSLAGGLGKTRIWNGTAFENAPMLNPDGSTWNAGTLYALVGHTHSGISATTSIGYAAGTGGTVTQLTSRSTAVTLHKLCGTITMFSAAQAAQALVTFTLTNSNIEATDYILVQHTSATNGGAWNFSVVAGNGSCTISLRNVSTASITQATILRFLIIKSVNT